MTQIASISADRAAVFGDVHGRADLLGILLTWLRAQGTETIVGVGDLIDRGPDSQDVVDLCIEHGVRSVQGNHEQWMLGFINGGSGTDAIEEGMGSHMGGTATLRSYAIDPAMGKTHISFFCRRKIPDSHQDFFKSMPVAIRLTVGGAPFWVTHAGVTKSKTWGVSPVPTDPSAVIPFFATSNPDHLLWPSSAPERRLVLDCPVISGHDAFYEPRDVGHAIGLDTGCGKRDDAPLTALLLPERVFVQATLAGVTAYKDNK